MFAYLFSIVVPVYQAQYYLEDCIRSVLAQSVHSWELILVDDGSTDDSPEICDRYAEQYNNIYVVHTQNRGPISARCTGYSLARGEYLVDLDADDKLTENALRVMFQNLKQHDIDMLIYNYRSINADGTPKRWQSRLSDGLYCGKERSELYAMLLRENALNLVWNKVSKTAMLQNGLPRPWKLLSVKSGDDVIIVSPLLADATTVQTISDCLYEYRQVDTSITHVFHSQKGIDFIRSRKFMLKSFQEVGLMDETLTGAFEENIYWTAHCLVWNCAKSEKSTDEKISFFRFLANEEMYHRSRCYRRKVKFKLHKMVSRWLFDHECYHALIHYEKLQARVKKLLGLE